MASLSPTSTRKPDRAADDTLAGCPFASHSAVPWRKQAAEFARLTLVLGAVAQSGSAPRSHRGGQGFESPQLHPGFCR
jgi:hypothetical protein